MKKVNFVPKDVQRILSSHKILEKYNEQKVFHKKAVLKNFSIFNGKHLRWNLFFNKKSKETNTWKNDIKSEKDVFPNTKQNKNRSKTQLYEKNLSFHDVLNNLVFLYFSTSRQAAFALNNKRWY